MSFFGLDVSIKFFVNLMLSIAFVVGILLVVSQEAFVLFNNRLQEEIIFKKKIIPQIEDRHIDIVDRTILKFPLVAGVAISISAFFLLLMLSK